MLKKITEIYERLTKNKLKKRLNQLREERQIINTLIDKLRDEDVIIYETLMRADEQLWENIIDIRIEIKTC